MGVSFIIPMHGGAVAIADALRSLQAQTDPGWEAIVVNDRASGACQKIVESLCAADRRIRLIHSPRQGAAAARNAGIVEAKADWLVFLDADDWIDPAYLGEMLPHCLSEPDIAGAVCAWIRVFPDGSHGAVQRCDNIDELFAIAAKRPPFAIHACLVAKHIVLEVGGFDESLNWGEDWYLWQKIGRTGASFAGESKALAFCRGQPAMNSREIPGRLEQARKIIERAGSEDPNLPRPHPRLRPGLPAATLAEGLYSAALQLAGALLWHRSSAVPLLEQIGEPFQFAVAPRTAARLILTGAADAACRPATQWRHLWPAIEANLNPFLLALQKKNRNTHFANQSINHMIELVISNNNKNEKYVLHNTSVDVVDLFAPIADLHNENPDVTRVALNVNAAGSELGTVWLALRHGHLPAGAIRDAIAVRLGSRIVELAMRPNGNKETPAGVPGRHHVEEFLDQVLAGLDPAFECTALAPDIDTGAATVAIAVRLSGMPVSHVRLPPAAAASPQTLRLAVKTVAGPELLRVIVREAVIGKPRAGIAEVRQRLLRMAAVSEQQHAQAARTTAPARPAAEPAGVDDPWPLRVAGTASVADLVTRMEREPGGPGRRGFFERLYACAEDPWNYTNAYDQTKYQQTLSLITRTDIDRALEIACAGGHFTRHLAPKVKHLTACDISLIALQRAAGRCADLNNIVFEKMDVGALEMPDKFDLIVGSEVLYYLHDLDTLRSVADRIAGALDEGGQLVLAHAHVIADEPDKPGFDWPLPFGAKVIGDVFAGQAHLCLSAEIITPLYRIQSYIRSNNPAIATAGVSRKIFDKQPVPVPDTVAASVRLTGGQAAPRRHHETAWTRSLPILMYHRVAPRTNPELAQYCVNPADFAEQMAFLKEAGYYGIGWDALLAHLTHEIPFPGLPVVITFDDGYGDFTDFALPTLEENGFTATIFIVTGQIGGCNEWDRSFGPAITLLGSDQLSKLRARGIRFGSHSATHAPLAVMPLADMARELRSSKQRLEAELGEEINVLAYPYGSHDQIVAQAAGAAGYALGLTSASRHCDLSDPPLSLPRISILASTSFEEFVKVVSNRKAEAAAGALRRTCRFVLHAGQPDEAVDLARYWLDRSPGNLETLLVLAGLLDEAGRSSEADAALEAAMAADLADAHAHDRLIAVLEGKGRLVEAIEIARRGARKFTGNAGAHLRLGQLLMRTDAHEEAAAAFRLAIKADPQRPVAYKQLAAALARLGSRSEAVDVLSEAARHFPEDAGFDLALGKLLSRLERFAEARPVLSRAVERPGAGLDIYLRLARAHERVGETGAAVKVLEAARELFPDEPAIHSRLAALLVQEKDYAGAETALRRAITLKPGDDPGLHLRLEQVCVRQGRQSEAAAVIRDAASRFPDNVALRERLAKLSQ